MSREQIYENLNEIFQDVFDDYELTVSDDTTADDVDGWDSLNHLTLINEIESEFGIKFTMNEIQKSENVGELVDAIISHLDE